MICLFFWTGSWVSFDGQRDNLVASIKSLNRLAGALHRAARRVLFQALDQIPPALDVLINERPRIVTALKAIRARFRDTATRLVNDAGSDLVKNLQNLGPALGALAEIGPELDAAIALAPTFPFSPSRVDQVHPRRLYGQGP